MRNDINLAEGQAGWEISAKSALWHDDFYESIFFTGNGRMGVRGYIPAESDKRPVQAGLYIAGVFDEIKPGITDIVHLPTPVWEEVSVNGAAAVLKPGSEIKRSLNLRDGVFSAEYILSAPDGDIAVLYERFISMDKVGCIVQRTILTPSAQVDIYVSSGINIASMNCPVPDDQMKDNDETICLWNKNQALDFNSNGFTLEAQTHKTGLAIGYNTTFQNHSFTMEGPFHNKGKSAGTTFSIHASPGQSCVLDKCCHITTSRDKDPRISTPETGWTYGGMLEANSARWQRRWKSSDIEIKGKTDIQTAIRYNVAQLIMNGPAGDDSVSIGARGLTHARYKGCYFWDTEFFLMPFYQHTHPQTAKNLMRYRTANLPAARAHAAKMNLPGARYPWMASFDGSEQCESWDIGSSEVHVTADIVYAMDSYINSTSDTDFYPEAAEVYIETARYWAGRISPGSDGKINLIFVKGPDEYCGITCNNLFTNALVRHNLLLAVKAAEFFKQNLPSMYKELSIKEDEPALWEKLADELPIPKNPHTGKLQQDETFHLLEPVALNVIKQSEGASYHNTCYDRLQRYRVVKQADLLLLMTRMPHLFTVEQRRDAWEEYEPICLHDSTLSYASHALLAAQNGYYEKADEYFEKALFLDLKDVMGNTGKEGLHLACFGEVWHALIFGYCKMGQPDTEKHVFPSGIDSVQTEILNSVLESSD